MSAYWISDKLQGKGEITIYSKVKFSIKPNRSHVISMVYVVDKEYFLDQDVVTRAINEDAKHIVYFEITKPTIAGNEFAKNNGLKIWSVGSFISAVLRGRV